MAPANEALAGSRSVRGTSTSWQHNPALGAAVICKEQALSPTCFPAPGAGISLLRGRPGMRASRSHQSNDKRWSNCGKHDWPNSAQQKSALIQAARRHSARHESPTQEQSGPGRGAMSPRPRVRPMTYASCRSTREPVWSARQLPARWSISVFFVTGGSVLPHQLSPENVQSNSEGHRCHTLP